MKTKLKLASLLISISMLNSPVFSDEKNKGLNFYTGMFDFSDDGKRAALYGVEHQNENLYRDTFFGRISPVTGAMITADSATYIYTGIEANYSVGVLNLTPSFTPGLYRKGSGKDPKGIGGHAHGDGTAPPLQRMGDPGSFSLRGCGKRHRYGTIYLHHAGRDLAPFRCPHRSRSYR